MAKLNPLKPEYSRYGSFDMLGENNKKQLHDLVEGLCGTSHTYGSVEQKIGDLYSMGMDSVRLNKEGAKPIKADIKRIERQNAKILQAFSDGCTASHRHSSEWAL